MIKKELVNDSLIGKTVIYQAFNKIEVGKVTSLSPDKIYIRCIFRVAIQINFKQELYTTYRYGDTSESCNPSDLTIINFDTQD